MSKKLTSHETRELRPRGTASGIPVWCLHDQIVAADSLKPFPDGNYRIHKATQLDRFETVVAGTDGKKGNGWRRPVVLSQRGYIVRGHGAWQMAKRRGWDVPIEIQKYATLAEEIRDLIADNHLAELAENDDDALQKLFGRLDAGEIALTGYSEADLADLRQRLNSLQSDAENALADKSPPKSKPIDATYEVVITCADEAEQRRWFDKLTAEHAKCRLLTL